MNRFLLTAGIVAAMLSASPLLAAPPAAIDACALLTRGEVTAVTGKPVESVQPFDNGVTTQGAHSTTCIWASPLPPGVEPDPTKRLGGRGFVVVSVMNWPGGPSDAAKFLADFHKAFAEHGIDSKPVKNDIGADDSLWWGDGVAARKNGVSIGVSVAQFGDREARRPQSEGLARVIIKKLPAKP
jgi:hypothetical protein